MNPKELLHRIQVQNLQRRHKIYRKPVAEFCDAVLRSLNRPGQGLSVVFIGARKMRSMNRKYLQRDYETDVLSFSYKGTMMDEREFLGEILISPEVAFHNAMRFNSSPEKEIRKLLVHGILHLLGYDHETDRGQMNRFQARLLHKKFFSNMSSLGDFRANS